MAVDRSSDARSAAVRTLYARYPHRPDRVPAWSRRVDGLLGRDAGRRVTMTFAFDRAVPGFALGDIQVTRAGFDQALLENQRGPERTMFR